MTADDVTCRIDRGPANVWSRRVSLIPVRPGEGRLTEPTMVVQPWGREPLFVPQIGRRVTCYGAEDRDCVARLA